MKFESLLAVVVMGLAVGTVQAQTEAAAVSEPKSAWSVEVTPYAWLAGIDADVTVQGKETSVDQSFSDLVDKVDLAGSLMVVADHDRWEVFGQGDYFALSQDGSVGELNGEIDSDSYILTGGTGYRFDGPFEGSKIAVLGGARYTHMKNELKIHSVGSVDKTSEILDALFMLRPSIPLMENLRFNPTLNIGAGDSDLTYELQPELQYNFTEAVAGRFGYRRVYYKEEQSNGNEFDGSFTGFLIGLGVIL
ncbi:MAG: outer membrane beta-barrel protein [Lentisphaerae bacterium]|nr:outer membrane beta-barrel protein [Lentisphaerota bacterium]